MEFTPKLKEEIIDKLEQILESIKIIKERCKDYHTLDDFFSISVGNDCNGSMYYETSSNRRND